MDFKSMKTVFHWKKTVQQRPKRSYPYFPARPSTQHRRRLPEPARQTSETSLFRSRSEISYSRLCGNKSFILWNRYMKLADWIRLAMLAAEIKLPGKNLKGLQQPSFGKRGFILRQLAWMQTNSRACKNLSNGFLHIIYLKFLCNGNRDVKPSLRAWQR